MTLSQVALIRDGQGTDFELRMRLFLQACSHRCEPEFSLRHYHWKPRTLLSCDGAARRGFDGISSEPRRLRGLAHCSAASG